MPRILFDQNVPRPLARPLQGHVVEFAFRLGWAALLNGELFDAADAAGFEVFVTCDQNMPHQHGLSRRQMAIVIRGSDLWPVIETRVQAVIDAVGVARPGSVAVVRFRTSGA